MQSFMVLTGSMHPTIDPGSMVYVRKEQFYNSDDIISFTVEGGDTVTHRVVRSERNGNTVQYITKGDANNIEDKNPVPADKIIGKVFVFVPYVGHAVNFLKTPNGFITMIVVPISLFIAIELWNIKRELEKQVEKKMLEKMQLLQQSTQIVTQ
jgi:signal peptidase I